MNHKPDDQNKIEIRNVYLIFGSERSKAFRMLKKGKSKNEILKETGCTIAVNNASLSVREGEIFVIMGLSGSGKSSLLRCINRLNKPTSGEIQINGEAGRAVAFPATEGTGDGIPAFRAAAPLYRIAEYRFRTRAAGDGEKGT